jgi:hypothetical protein
MAIAQHPILANRTHGSVLPPSWRTLYELTKVPDSELQRALEDGRVHPGLERRDVRQWRVSGQAEEAAPPPWNPADALERLRRATAAEQTRGADRPALIYTLKFIIRLLEAEVEL